MMPGEPATLSICHFQLFTTLPMLVFASENELFESSRSNIREVAGGREISMRTDHIHIVLSCYDMQNVTCGCDVFCL